MSTSEIALHASTLRVLLRFDGAAGAQRALEAVWRLAALRSFVAPQRDVSYSLREQGDAYLLSHPAGELLCYREDQLAPRVEWLMYQEIFDQQRRDGLCVLHASCVVDGDRAILFAGESGAGKSAMARAAVEAGLGYFADEHVITDGRSIWGLPRAIHLDAHTEGEPAPPWHRGADIASYRLRDAEGRVRYTPLVPVHARQVPETPLPIERAVLVSSRRSDRDVVAQLTPSARLATLRQSALVTSDALGTLATLPAAFDLQWRDPTLALQQLRAALGTA